MDSNAERGSASSLSHGLYGIQSADIRPLLLKGVDCWFEVTGDLASIQITQLYQSNLSEAVECVYCFPIPATASMYDLEVEINGKVIRARIEEKNRAEYEAMLRKRQGMRTALLTRLKANLFRLELGNVQPGDRILVRISYFQLIEKLQEECTLRIPFVPGIRYFPSTYPSSEKRWYPGARLQGHEMESQAGNDELVPNPPMYEADDPRGAPLFVRGEIVDKTGSVTDIETLQHPLGLTGPGLCPPPTSEAYVGRLGCDWVLRWKQKSGEELQATVWKYPTPDMMYALVRLSAPLKCTPDAFATQSLGVGADYYILIDASGSMKGDKWKAAVKAARHFLGFLQDSDRVRLGWFNTRHFEINNQGNPLRKQEVMQQSLFQRLEDLIPDGGTELLATLDRILPTMDSKDRRQVLLLFTDGQVGNEEMIVEYTTSFPNLAINCLGIDTHPNDALFEQLARQHGGYWHQASPCEDMEMVAGRLRGFVMDPLLNRIEVPSGWDLAMPINGTLHPGQMRNLLLRCPSSNSFGAATSLKVTRSDGEVVELPWIEGGEGHEAIGKLWSRERIQHLIQQGLRVEAVAESIAANVICRWTAFVAWDESQKVTLANRFWHEPSPSPGYVRSAGFGAASGQYIPTSRGEAMLSRIASIGKGLAHGASIQINGVTVPSGYEDQAWIHSFDVAGAAEANVDRYLRLMGEWKWPREFDDVARVWATLQILCRNAVEHCPDHLKLKLNSQMLVFLPRLKDLVFDTSLNLSRELEGVIRSTEHGIAIRELVERLSYALIAVKFQSGRDATVGAPEQKLGTDSGGA